MIKIKFSHRYNKMPNDLKNTFIVGVIQAYPSNFGKKFIDYDTEIIDGTFYPLPRGTVILILLLTKGQLWTTIRRHWPEKFDYYKSLIGEQAEIIIEGKK